jgi:hypothetical protein
MSLENKKLEVDVIKSRIDILHKKILILLGAITGTWFYGLDFLKSDEVVVKGVGLILFTLFLFLVIGLISSFLKLNKFDKDLERIQNGVE